MAANIRQLLDMRQRAVDPVSDRRLFCKAHAHSSMVERLGHATELEGHRGCVNCLEWNSDGSLCHSQETISCLLEPRTRRCGFMTSLPWKPPE
ncbi:Protein ALTERED SEED GERMINATION 2 [Geodia barretti]|uniref:Protein ALTERED SEED GERMINATION 2 n=1 Tax=Geodia barretti TaxID=519541 RepID=A0AA35U0W4_GEOBA|nr:Protein ALTERED SEED GERMINATION 2 [Geodia barretti]